MVIVALLAVVAFCLIRSLMWVVARDEGAASHLPAVSTDADVELRAATFDDARTLLLPAAPDTDERVAGAHADAFSAVNAER